MEYIEGMAVIPPVSAWPIDNNFTVGFRQPDNPGLVLQFFVPSGMLKATRKEGYIKSTPLTNPVNAPDSPPVHPS